MKKRDRESKKIFYGVGEGYKSKENTPTKEAVSSPRYLRSPKQGSLLSPRALNLDEEEGQIESPARKIEFVEASTMLDAEILVALSEGRYGRKADSDGDMLKIRQDHAPMDLGDDQDEVNQAAVVVHKKKRSRVQRVDEPELHQGMLARDDPEDLQRAVSMDQDEVDDIVFDNEQEQNQSFEFSLEYSQGPRVEPMEPMNQPERRQEILAEVAAAPAPVQMVAVVEPLHFSTYGEIDYPCPEFLNELKNTEKKTIFECLYKDGARFLCSDNRGVRYLGIYPSHEEIVIQAMPKPYQQFYLYKSKTDHRYSPTWVSAVIRDKTGVFYPVHIVSKTYLGSVKNMISYPNKIKRQFASDKYPNHWPDGLGRECLIITVNNEKQQRELMSEYEKLVVILGPRADELLPSYRIFYRGALSEIYSVQSCKQRSILAFGNLQRQPNVIPYVNRRLSLLELEQTLLTNCVKSGLSQQDFERACNLFFSPAALSHELACAHFTLSQIIKFTGVLIGSRGRMIDLKGRLCSKYAGLPEFHHQNVTRLLEMMDQTIATRTRTIDKVIVLKTYAVRLCSILNVDYTDDNMENLLCDRLQASILRRGVENINIRDNFQSANSLVVWMLKKNINLEVQFGHVTRNITPHALAENIVENILAENRAALVH